MADVHDKTTRSFNMSRIRSGNTKPEMLVRKFLHAQGFRYKLHDKKLPVNLTSFSQNTKPSSLFIAASGMAITIANTLSFPKQGPDWWLNKINTNRSNDTKAVKALKKDGGRSFMYGSAN
jgi:DNA mismatch endonuclease (patch repair protein)